MTRNEQIMAAVAGAAALFFLAAGAKRAPGGAVKVPSSVTETSVPFAPPPHAPVYGPEQHMDGYVYTPHRYPPGCGNDITALIHHGLSPLTLPAEDDMLWLSAPPSEGIL